MELFHHGLAMLPQNPQALFTEITVREELLEALSDEKLPEDEQAARVAEISREMELDSLLETHPYDLSGGEQQRLALGKILLRQPAILLLDEPTKGLDPFFKRTLADIFKRLCQSGMTILMVTHDIEFCAEYADRCALFFDGEIVSCGTPKEFFSGNSFYTTTANRVAGQWFPDAITWEGGSGSMRRGYQISQVETAHRKRTAVSSLLIFIAIPAVIILGFTLFNDRKYILVSWMILAMTVAPFFMVFEKRKPKAREIVLIAMMCALTLCVQLLCRMTIAIRAGTAIIIASGIALGPEAGFLIGALSRFGTEFL